MLYRVTTACVWARPVVSLGTEVLLETGFRRQIPRRFMLTPKSVLQPRFRWRSNEQLLPRPLRLY